MQCWKWIQVDHYCFTGVPFQNSWPAASWVKRLGAGSKNFPTNSRYKFLTEEIIGCQNLNFVPKFHQNEGFWATNFVLMENILTRRKFANKLKLKGTIQFHHDVTAVGYNKQLRVVAEELMQHWTKLCCSGNNINSRNKHLKHCQSTRWPKHNDRLCLAPSIMQWVGRTFQTTCRL